MGPTNQSLNSPLKQAEIQVSGRLEGKLKQGAHIDKGMSLIQSRLWY